MKNLIILLSTIFFVSCSKDVAQNETELKSYRKEIEFLIETYGFNPEKIEVKGDKLIVEDCMIFDLDDFFKKYSSPSHFCEGDNTNEVTERFHFRSPLVVTTPTAPRTIIVNMVYCPSSWQPIVPLAVNVWNNLNLRIKLVGQSSSNNIGGAINVTGGTLPSNVFAQGSFPTVSGTQVNPGNIITLNIQGPSQNSSQKLKTLVHEIGHCLGFCHTDAFENGSIWITDMSAQCTNDYNNSSVMKQGLMDFGLTKCDKEAFTSVYGYWSFKSNNISNQYIRHSYNLGYISNIISDTDKKDATFKMVPALNGQSGCVSFESKNYPGSYLRHFNYRIKLNAFVDNISYKNDASFKIVTGLANSNGKSFESCNFPGRFIRHKNYELWTDPNDNTSIFKSDATFILENPKWF